MAKKTTIPQPIPSLYKVLDGDQSYQGGTHTWSLPTADGPGEWHEITAKLVKCSAGFHLTTHPHTRYYGEDRTTYLVEVDTTKPILLPEHDDDEWVVSRVRLVRKMEGAELDEALSYFKPFPTPPHLYIITEDGKQREIGVEFPLPTNEPGEWITAAFDPTRRDGGFEGSIPLVCHPQKHHFKEGVELFEAETEGLLYVDCRGTVRATRARLIRRVPPSEMKRMGIGVEREWKRGRGRRSWSEIQKYDPRGLSPAERFVRLMVDHGGVDVGKGVESDPNANVFSAIELAIRSGLEFKKSTIFLDVDAATSRIEELYKLAIRTGNESATVAIESAIGREPWSWSGRRLHLRADLAWKGHQVVVTAFDDDQNKIRLCASKEVPHVNGKGTYAYESLKTKVQHKFLVSRDEFDVVAVRHIKAQRHIKAVEKLVQQLATRKVRVHPASVFFWTKEEMVAVRDWIQMFVDAKEHRKSRVKPADVPCLVAAYDDEIADNIARTKIAKKVDKVVGPRPTHENFGSDNWKWKYAAEVWEVRRKEEMAKRMHSRKTKVGALARAFAAWQATNFEGDAIDYIDS